MPEAGVIHERPHVDVLDYRPDPNLDGDIADVCYAAVHGWPDQRPVTAALMRSWLRSPSLTATTLALHRDAAGALRAAAALRWPATPDGDTMLWGPVVHPSAQGHGLGSALLGALLDVAARRPGVRVTTFAVPEQRRAGWALFERRGWTCAATASILVRPIPGPALPPAAVPVRVVGAGEYIAPALADLVGSARPQLGYAIARDTYARWSVDDRYTRQGLLLVDGPTGLLGAALVYPLRHLGDPEPVEATLNELFVRGDLDAATAGAVRSALVSAFVTTAAELDAEVARATVDEPPLARALLAAGFTVADDVRYYSPPPL